MRRSIRLLALALCALLVFPMFSCGGGGGQMQNQEAVIPPAPVHKVNSVVIRYNEHNVVGTLSVDLSLATIVLTAEVLKTDDSVDGTVIFVSSVPEVATVAATGVVTLLKKGETVITAMAGGKTHQIVLVVGNDYVASPAEYTITVAGGTSSLSAAPAGGYVTLTASVPEHQEFTGWRYTYTDSGETVIACICGQHIYARCIHIRIAGKPLSAFGLMGIFYQCPLPMSRRSRNLRKSCIPLKLKAEL